MSEEFSSYSPATALPAACHGAQPVTLKWFNPARGFGFVVAQDDPADIFLHASALKNAGVEMLHPGAELICELSERPRGRQVARIVEILSEGDPEAAGARPQRPQPGDGPVEELGAEVKWFRADKGFGFLIGETGGSDIFVHRSVVERSGLYELRPGQRLGIKVRRVSRGREAVEIWAIN